MCAQRRADQGERGAATAVSRALDLEPAGATRVLRLGLPAHLGWPRALIVCLCLHFMAAAVDAQPQATYSPPTPDPTESNETALAEPVVPSGIEAPMVLPVTAWTPQAAAMTGPVARYETVGGEGGAQVSSEVQASTVEANGDGAVFTEATASFPAFSSVVGAGGGLRIADAQLGPEGTFRMQLALSYFAVPEFLRPTDEHSRLGGALSLAFVPAESFEVYLALESQANSNRRGDPELLQVLGDVTAGAKVGTRIQPWLSIGLDGRLQFLNPVGDTGFMLTSTGVELRALMTADLRALPEPLPLLLRANLGYLFDNSQHLIEGIEEARAAEFGASSEGAYLSRIERFGLGIQRVDRVAMGLGVELPVEIAPRFYMHPLAELSLALPVNRQGYDCEQPSGDVEALGRAAGPDGCLQDVGFSAAPSTMSVGMRLVPPVPGLSFLLAADVGFGGVRRFVRELAPNAPYNIWLAVAYGFGGEGAEGDAVSASGPSGALPWLQPPQARIDGLIVSQGLGTGVADAVVRYPGRQLSAQLTDPEGRFVSYALPAGPVEVEVSHPDYESRTCVVQMPVAEAPPAAAVVRDGVTGWQRVPLRCELVSQPRDGALSGHVVDEEGQPVSGASVELSGALSLALVTDQGGDFRRTNLPRGTYQVRVDAKGFLLKLATVEVPAGGLGELRVSLQRAPVEAQVRVAPKEVHIRRQILFNFNSADIDERSYPLLEEVADVLLRNPQLRKIEIQGHTDNVGEAEFNRQLSEARAAAVRAWLTAAGVGETRLEARGYGDLRPLVPNITEHNRAMNRRVQFIIREQD